MWTAIGTTELTRAARAAFTGTIADHRRHEVDLAEFLRAQGVDESSSGMLAQPLEVVFSDRLIARLDHPTGVGRKTDGPGGGHRTDHMLLHIAERERALLPAPE